MCRNLFKKLFPFCSKPLNFFEDFLIFFQFFSKGYQVFLTFTFQQNFFHVFKKLLKNFSAFQNFTKNFGILTSVLFQNFSQLIIIRMQSSFKKSKFSEMLLKFFNNKLTWFQKVSQFPKSVSKVTTGRYRKNMNRGTNLGRLINRRSRLIHVSRS